MNKRGFTLLEVVMVSIIIAILISIAVPTYMNTMERTRGREAVATLQAIHAAERVYSAQRRIYIDLPFGTSAADNSTWDAVAMDNPNQSGQRAFNYSLTVAGGGTTFTATASRIGGPYSSSYITIDQGGTVSKSNWPLQ